MIFSGPETGKRKRVTRKADAFAEFGGVLARTTILLVGKLMLTHFSLPISGPMRFVRGPLSGALYLQACLTVVLSMHTYLVSSNSESPC